MMGLLIIFSSFLILILFLRLWLLDWHDIAFNPYLGPPARLADRILDFLRPLFFSLSSRFAVALALLLLIALRGVLFFNTRHAWRISIGAALAIRDINQDSLVACLVFSLAAMLRFLARVWALAWLLQWLNRGRSRSDAADAVQWAALPVSSFPPGWRLAAIFGVNMLMVALLFLAGTATPLAGAAGELQVTGLEWAAGPVRALWRVALLSVAAMLDVLMLAHSLILICLLFSLAGLVVGSPVIQFRAREWMQLVLGRLARYPVVIGPLDLTPLLYFLLLPIAYAILLNPLGFLLSWT